MEPEKDQNKVNYQKISVVKPYLLYPDEENNLDFDEKKVTGIRDLRKKADILIEIIGRTPRNYINRNLRKYGDDMAYISQIDIGRRLVEDGKERLERDLKVNKKAINILSKSIDKFSNIEDLDERASLLEWAICCCDNTNSERSRKLLLENIGDFINSDFLDERLLTLKALKYCDEDEIIDFKKQCLDSLVFYIDNNRTNIDRFITSENNLSPETNEKCHSILAAAFEYVAVEGDKDDALDALNYLENLNIDNKDKMEICARIETEDKEVAYMIYKTSKNALVETIFLDNLRFLIAPFNTLQDSYNIVDYICGDIPYKLYFDSIIATNSKNKEVAYKALEDLISYEKNDKYFDNIMDELLYIVSEAELTDVAIKALELSFNITNIYNIPDYITKLNCDILLPYENKWNHNIKELIYKNAKEYCVQYDSYVDSINSFIDGEHSKIKDFITSNNKDISSDVKEKFNQIFANMMVVLAKEDDEDKALDALVYLNNIKIMNNDYKVECFATIARKTKYEKVSVKALHYCLSYINTLSNIKGLRESLASSEEKVIIQYAQSCN